MCVEGEGGVCVRWCVSGGGAVGCVCVWGVLTWRV